MKSTTRVHILLRNSWTGATESTKAVSPVQVPTIRHAAMQDVELFFFFWVLSVNTGLQKNQTESNLLWFKFGLN